MVWFGLALPAFTEAVDCAVTVIEPIACIQNKWLCGHGTFCVTEQPISELLPGDERSRSKHYAYTRRDDQAEWTWVAYLYRRRIHEGPLTLLPQYSPSSSWREFVDVVSAVISPISRHDRTAEYIAKGDDGETEQRSSRTCYVIQ